MRTFLQPGTWKLKYDPAFIVAAHKAKVKAMDEIRRTAQEQKELNNMFGLMQFNSV